MTKGRGIAFYDKQYDPAADLQPGEHRTHADISSGFIRITVAELNNQTIFVCSKDWVKRLQAHYHIPDDNVVNLIDKCNSSPEGIPESELEGKLGLNMFIERFGRIEPDPDFPLIIHCRAGMNRSPVAAVIFLVTKGMTGERAQELVEKTYRTQRNKGFKLDPFGHYHKVLDTAFNLKENIDPNALTIRRQVKRPKIDLSKVRQTRLRF